MSEPLRIWFMRTALDKRGGAEAVIVRIIQHLPRELFTPIAVWLYQAGGYGEALSQEGVRTHAGLARSRWDIRMPVRLIRLARREKPDLVVTTENALACFWAGVLKRMGLVPHLVLAFHTTRLVSRAVYFAVRFSAPVADRLVALTPSHRQFWRRWTQVDEERFVVIPNGVDTSVFRPVSDKLTQKKQLSIPSNKIIVGLVAYFKDVKNLPLFVEVAEQVLRQGADAHFVLVGDGPERPNIEKIIRQKALQAHFTLPGLCDAPLPWYQAFDILLLTSYTEALPLTILEAAACGVPAVATDVGGVRDVVVHGETGFIAPSGDAACLAHWVRLLTGQASLRQQMGQAARERVLRLFSLERMVQGYIDLFLQISRMQGHTSES
ncbi:N-acetyl-alpha-D-glucosaminyl L-malate synthase [bacterium HR15]|nr:N-acetyl-alpha-D-glucosaminyl L-malate synthase [bacterium HR15]